MLSGKRAPPIIAWVYLGRYGNANSARLLCCSVSRDVKSKSRGCSIAQFLFSVHFPCISFLPVRSRHNLTCIFPIFSLFKTPQEFSTISLFAMLKSLHFFPVTLHTRTFQLSQFIVKCSGVLDLAVNLDWSKYSLYLRTIAFSAVLSF